MSSIFVDRRIHFDERRCYTCNRWFFYEADGGMSPVCPWCAKKNLEEERRENARLLRSISSLRGYITRLKGKRA